MGPGLSADQLINLLLNGSFGTVALVILYKILQYLQERDKDSNKLLSQVVTFASEGTAQTSLLREAVQRIGVVEGTLVTSVNDLFEQVQAAPNKIADLVAARQDPVVKQVYADHEALKLYNTTAAQKLDKAQTGIDKLQTVPDLIKGLTDEVHQLSDDFKTYLKASDQVQALEKAVVDQGKVLSERFGQVERNLGDLVAKIPTPMVSAATIAQQPIAVTTEGAPTP
jgi:predicted RecB family endonuclease